MNPKYTVYNDGEIAVGLFVRDQDTVGGRLLHLGIRWLDPPPVVGRNGEVLEATNVMGGETGWFLLPHSFGVSVGQKLIEQKVADCGLADYFDEAAFRKMIAWLIEIDEISGAMEY